MEKHIEAFNAAMKALYDDDTLTAADKAMFLLDTGRNLKAAGRTYTEKVRYESYTAKPEELDERIGDILAKPVKPADDTPAPSDTEPVDGGVEQPVDVAATPVLADAGDGAGKVGGK